jgi:hypothetical protein
VDEPKGLHKKYAHVLCERRPTHNVYSYMVSRHADVTCSVRMQLLADDICIALASSMCDRQNRLMMCIVHCAQRVCVVLHV